MEALKREMLNKILKKELVAILRKEMLNELMEIKKQLTHKYIELRSRKIIVCNGAQ